jgi:hypothetical protein
MQLKRVPTEKCNLSTWAVHAACCGHRVQVMLRQAEAVSCRLVTVSQLIEQHAIK